MILTELGMKYFELFDLKTSKVNKKFKDIQRMNEFHDIFLLNDLLDMRDGLKTSNLSYNEIKDIIILVCCEN